MRSVALLAALLVVPAGSNTHRYERTVTPGAAGVNRLEVDLPLLAGARADLGDLRLFDGANAEVAYILVPPAPSEANWVRGTTLELVPTKTTSGFELDLGDIRGVDAVRFSSIPAPFLKHVTIEGSGDRVRWALLSDATVFDLPANELRRRDVEFTAGRFRYIRATWDDRSSSRVADATIEARVSGSSLPAPPLRAEVPFRVRSTERGKTRISVTLPGRGLPIEAIELRASNNDVFRQATITEPRLDGEEIAPVTLGTGRLRQTQRNGITASQMSVSITRPQSRELEIAVDDGDNPPLAVTNVVLRLTPQPTILFETAVVAPLTARYGNATLTAPAYDLEAAREALTKATAAVAQWAAAERNLQPATSKSAEVKFEGAAIDAARFSVVRDIAQAPAGLVLLPLDGDALARSNELRDIRIADSNQHQVPYVVERRSAPLVVKLPVGTRTQREGNTSIYNFTLPHPAPSGSRLVLTTSARVFSRHVEMYRSEDTSRGAEEALLTSATWRSNDSAESAVPLAFELPRDSVALQVHIDEGDNAPLPITTAEMQMPAYALRFFHPGTQLRLLYGDSAASAPQYDIELMAPRLFNEPAREIALVKAAAPAPEPAHTERRFFWIAIAGVALLLLILVAKLVTPLLREEARPRE